MQNQRKNLQVAKLKKQIFLKKCLRLVWPCVRPCAFSLAGVGTNDGHVVFVEVKPTVCTDTNNNNINNNNNNKKRRRRVQRGRLQKVIYVSMYVCNRSGRFERAPLTLPNRRLRLENTVGEIWLNVSLLSLLLIMSK